MRCFLCALLVLVMVCAQPRSQEIAPANPVAVVTEVGSAAIVDGFATAFNRGKVVVFVKATVTKKAVKFETLFGADEIDTVGRMVLDNGTLIGLIDALTATLAKPDAEYEKKTGKLTITNKEEKGKRIVRILDLEHFSTVGLDLDNSETLLRLLKRAKGIQEWMKDRATLLQK